MLFLILTHKQISFFLLKLIFNKLQNNFFSHFFLVIKLVCWILRRKNLQILGLKKSFKEERKIPEEEKLCFF